MYYLKLRDIVHASDKKLTSQQQCRL